MRIEAVGFHSGPSGSLIKINKGNGKKVIIQDLTPRLERRF